MRVSITDPDARKMRFGSSGAILPAYNVQIAKTLGEGAIVGLKVTSDHNDASGIENLLPDVVRRTRRRPEVIASDVGFINYTQLNYADNKGVLLYGPLQDLKYRHSPPKNLKPELEFIRSNSTVNVARQSLTCPAGKEIHLTLRPKDKTAAKGTIAYQFRWYKEHCDGCRFYDKCRPPGGTRHKSMVFYRKSIRSQQLFDDFAERVSRSDADKILSLRFRRELTHAKLKTEHGLDRFQLQGKRKATSETYLAATVYNLKLIQTLRKRVV